MDARLRAKLALHWIIKTTHSGKLTYIYSYSSDHDNRAGIRPSHTLVEVIACFGVSFGRYRDLRCKGQKGLVSSKVPARDALCTM